MDLRDDLTLVETALAGDVTCFTELCQRYYPPLVAIAQAILHNRHLAEDAAQEALAKAARMLDKLRDKRKFAAWLAAICRNIAKDLARTETKFHTTDDFDQIVAAPGPDQMTDVVRESLNALTGSARELVVLRYYDGMTYQQISAVLGLSEQAINGRLRRAKKKIAAYLTKNGFGKVKA